MHNNLDMDLNQEMSVSVLKQYIEDQNWPNLEASQGCLNTLRILLCLFQIREIGKYGVGVFATQAFAKNAILCDYPGEVYENKYFRQYLDEHPDPSRVKAYAQWLNDVCFLFLLKSFNLLHIACR